MRSNVWKSCGFESYADLGASIGGATWRSHLSIHGGNMDERTPSGVDDADAGDGREVY